MVRLVIQPEVRYVKTPRQTYKLEAVKRPVKRPHVRYVREQVVTHNKFGKPSVSYISKPQVHYSTHYEIEYVKRPVTVHDLQPQISFKSHFVRPGDDKGQGGSGEDNAVKKREISKSTNSPKIIDELKLTKVQKPVSLKRTPNVTVSQKREKVPKATKIQKDTNVSVEPKRIKLEKAPERKLIQKPVKVQAPKAVVIKSIPNVSVRPKLPKVPKSAETKSAPKVTTRPKLVKVPKAALVRKVKLVKTDSKSQQRTKHRLVVVPAKEQREVEAGKKGIKRHIIASSSPLVKGKDGMTQGEVTLRALLNNAKARFSVGPSGPLGQESSVRLLVLRKPVLNRTGWKPIHRTSPHYHHADSNR